MSEEKNAKLYESVNHELLVYPGYQLLYFYVGIGRDDVSVNPVNQLTKGQLIEIYRIQQYEKISPLV